MSDDLKRKVNLGAYIDDRVARAMATVRDDFVNFEEVRLSKGESIEDIIRDLFIIEIAHSVKDRYTEVLEDTSIESVREAIWGAYRVVVLNDDQS